MKHARRASPGSASSTRTGTPSASTSARPRCGPRSWRPACTTGRPSVTVHGVGHVELPEGAVVNGVVDGTTARTAALKRLWQDNRFECRNVILGIANQQVRRPRHEDAEPERRSSSAKALPFQAREIVALPMDQVVLDFVPLGEADPETNTDARPADRDAPPAGARRGRGGREGRPDRWPGWTCPRSPRCARSPTSSWPVEAVIDLGAHLTNIVIHNHGIPKVVRTVPRGGQELTERLADGMGIDLPEAETAKCEVGLTGGHREITEWLNEALRPLLAEIRSSIHYFSSSNNGNRRSSGSR